MINIFLNILAFGTLLSSLLVITAKNPVIAVIFLISVFINAAGYLMLLGVSFLGITYIILYVGAITVLFLFVIMMINIKLTDILETGSQYTKNLPLAFAIGLLFIYELFTFIPFTSKNVAILSLPLDLLNSINQNLMESSFNSFISVNTSFHSVIADSNFTDFLQVEILGQGLYTYWAFWLILSSVILLLAMVAPIILSRFTKNIN